MESCNSFEEFAKKTGMLSHTEGVEILKENFGGYKEHKGDKEMNFSNNFKNLIEEFDNGRFSILANSETSEFLNFIMDRANVFIATQVLVDTDDDGIVLVYENDECRVNRERFFLTNTSKGFIYEEDVGFDRG